MSLAGVTRDSSRFRSTRLAPLGDSVHEDFVEAARHGQGTTRLEYLLSQGANVDARDGNGLTALYHAAFQGDNENVRFLIDRGADVNSEHSLLGTPVAVAALRGHSGVVETLLQHKVDILMFVPGLGSVLHCACFGGNSGIFSSILDHNPDYDYLASYREVRFKAFSTISAMRFRPSGKLRMREYVAQDPSIRCSPILLAAERCHFEILRLCESKYNHDYVLLSLWESVPDRGEKTAQIGRPQRRTNSSWNSVESRSGPSYASKESSISAWSTLGFPLVASEHPRSTLLMWAAASLNLPLIGHLLEAGASARTMDESGQAAVHYAAAPSLDATFKDVKECLRLLLADQASVSTEQRIQIAQKAPPMRRPIKTPLQLVVTSDHAALDPRTSFKCGADVHRTCISAFLDPLPSKYERGHLAQEALLHALSNRTCPSDSIKLLCEYAIEPGHDMDPQLKSYHMDEALNYAVTYSAPEPDMLVLLGHGANPNAELIELPLITAIDSQNSEAVAVLLKHGADPNYRPKSGPPMTPLERAKRYNRHDLVDMLIRHDTIPRLSALTPNHSAGPTTAEASLRRIQSSRSPALFTVLGDLNDVEKVDELDDLGEDITSELETQSTNNPRDSVGPSRPWFPGIPSFPLSRFRRNSKPK